MNFGVPQLALCFCVCTYTFANVRWIYNTCKNTENRLHTYIHTYIHTHTHTYTRCYSCIHACDTLVKTKILVHKYWHVGWKCIHKYTPQCSPEHIRWSDFRCMRHVVQADIRSFELLWCTLKYVCAHVCVLYIWSVWVGWLLNIVQAHICSFQLFGRNLKHACVCVCVCVCACVRRRASVDLLLYIMLTSISPSHVFWRILKNESTCIHTTEQTDARGSVTLLLLHGSGFVSKEKWFSFGHERIFFCKENDSTYHYRACLVSI